MNLYHIFRRQRLPIDIDTAWDFFSSPENLAKITPEYFDVRIKNEVPAKIYQGLIIVYVMQVVPGFPFSWVTEFTHVQKPDLFVDEQRFGPFKFWHHKHKLEEIKGGIEVVDILDYAMSYFVIGQLAHGAFVRKLLESVFDYRREALERIFGTMARPVL